MSCDLINSKVHADAESIDSSQLRFLTQLHYITIREMVNLDTFVEDASIIGKSLQPRLTKREVEKAIDELLSMGYLNRDESGKLINSEKPLTTGRYRALDQSSIGLFGSSPQIHGRSGQRGHGCVR